MNAESTMSTTTDGHRRKRVLAISSGGGHWVQLLRLSPAFVHQRTTFVTVREDYRVDVPDGAAFRVIVDATRWDKLRFIRMSLQIAAIIARVRPHVVVSTGAAPGVVAIMLARIVRARTVWVDSIANCEELSLSGRQLEGRADLWLTQWEHLATPDGPRFAGATV